MLFLTKQGHDLPGLPVERTLIEVGSRNLPKLITTAELLFSRRSARTLAGEDVD